MKMLATLMLLSALFLTAVLPGSVSPSVSAADTPTANHVNPVNESDLKMLIASKMVIGGRPRG